MKSVVFLSLFSLAFTKQIVTFHDCDDASGGKVNSLSCDPCDAEPCQIKRGTTYKMNVNFTANEQSVGATTIVHGIIDGLELPFKTEDACASKALGCPVTKGIQMYNDSIYCSPSYPKVKLVAKWMLQDKDKKNIFCFDIPLVIVDG